MVNNKTLKMSLVQLKKVKWIRLIVVLFFLVIFLFPMYWGVVTSLKTQFGAFELPPEWLFKPTLGAYKSVFETADWSNAYFNTIVIALGSVLIALSAGILAAYIVARMRRPYMRDSILFLAIFLRMVHPVVQGIPLYNILGDYNLLDKHISLMFVYSTIHLPYVIWMMQGFFADIPIELEEVALIDGATKLQTLVRIVFPLARPGLVATLLFCFTISWNEFFFALILTRFNAITVPVVMGGFLKIYNIEWAQMCAAATLAGLPMIFFCFIIQKHLARGLAGGSIKG